MTRRIIITDPGGFTHSIEFSPSAVYGAENLVHAEPPELRDHLLPELLDRMRVTGHGTHRGYRWDTPA